MKILFICKYNRFRSKIAEAYFKKINKNSQIKALSAGLIKGKPTPLSTVKTARRLRIKISRKTKPIKESLLESKNLKYIIITANDVPQSLFKRFNKKIIKWKIKDASAKNQRDVEERIKKIMKKVSRLIKITKKEK